MPFMTPLLYVRLMRDPSSSHSLFRRCLDSKFDTCVQALICNSPAIHFCVILVSARRLNCAACAYSTYYEPCVNVWDRTLSFPVRDGTMVRAEKSLGEVDRWLCGCARASEPWGLH